MSIRPGLGAFYWLISRSPSPPEVIEIFSDNESYTEVTGFKLGPISLTFYPFYYSEHGFHHLRIVPDGNESASLEVDFQVGFYGFVEHILPYLKD